MKSFQYEDVEELYNVVQSNLPAANGVMHIVSTLRKKTSPDNLGNPQVCRHFYFFCFMKQ